MSDILIERDPSPMKLEVLGVDDWAVCFDAVAVEEKSYAQTETTFILEGRAEITSRSGAQNVEINPGDLVTFLPETRCVWNVTEPMERRYRTG